jgi:hypothetical protein
VAPPTSTSTSVELPPAESTSTTVTTEERSTTSTTLSPADDVDGDGIPNPADACPQSDDGEVVGDDGCSVCPCDTDPAGVRWESHAAYVRCVRDQSRVQRLAGDLTSPERRDAIMHALRSTCGRPETTRCCDPAGLGPRCNIRLPEECAESWIDIGPGSCVPNPCGGADDGGGD